jgi:aspartate/glutamate racemase
MPRVGIVGGLGPESTIDYYRRILEAWERLDPTSTPSIVIDSLDVATALRLVERDRPALVDYLLASLVRLAGAGATVFARHGIEVVAPGERDRAWVHDRYVGELLKGDFRDETRRQVAALVDRLRVDEGVDGVILGGTELPLLLGGTAIAGIPALDTTALHVAAIVGRLRQTDVRP